VILDFAVPKAWREMAKPRFCYCVPKEGGAVSGKGRRCLWSVELATPAGAWDELLPPIATGPIDI